MTALVSAPAADRSASPAPPRRRRRGRAGATGYLFIAPFFLVFLVFQAFALLAAFALSLTDWKGVQGGQFIGATNYLALLNDRQFLLALGHTALLWVMTVPLLSLGGLGLAYAVNSTLVRWAGALRALLFLPILPSLVVVGSLFLLLLDPTFGLPNRLLGALGIPAISLKTNPAVALPVLAAVTVWRYIGYNMVIHLAALQNLSTAVLESAELDGASSWQRFWHVVVPMSKPMLVFTTVLSTIGVINLFDEPYVLFGSEAGPGQAGLMLGPYMYRQGFEYFNLGYASAITYALAAIAFIFSLLQIRAGRDGR